MKRHLISAALVATFGLMGTFHASAGTIGGFTFTDDASSQISSSKTYTTKADPGTSHGGVAATINGVLFDKGSISGSGIGATYSAPNMTYVNNGGGSGGNGELQLHGGNATDVPTGAGATGVNNLLTDMVFTNPLGDNLLPGNVTTITLSGLTAGVTYSARIYYRQFGVADRDVTFVFDEDGAGPLTANIFLNEDAGENDFVANALTYQYVAQSDGFGGALPLVITLTQSNNNGWHLYGVTNEVVNEIPEPSSLILAGLAALGGLFVVRRKTRR